MLLTRSLSVLFLLLVLLICVDLRAPSLSIVFLSFLWCENEVIAEIDRIKHNIAIYLTFHSTRRGETIVKHAVAGVLIIFE